MCGTYFCMGVGKRLPKIMPLKVLNFGVKGVITYFFYVGIELILLVIIYLKLGFPIISLDELFLDLNGTINLFYAHDPKNLFYSYF